VMLRNYLSASCYPFTKIYYSLYPGIRILMYHRVCPYPNYDQLVVSPQHFQEQMAWLAKKYRVISLSQAVDEIMTNRVKFGVVVTFDDGYLDNLTNAVPILRQHHIPATIFVATEFAEQTSSHPRFPNETAGRRSREKIENRLGIAPDFFCYPSGNFGARELKMVQEAGYKAALSIAPGVNRHATPLTALKRTEMTNKDKASDLKLKLAGAFDPIHQFIHWKRT